MKILKIAFLLILLITVSELIYYVFITNPTLLDTINPLAAKNKTIIPKNNQISNSGGNQVMLGDIKQYFLNKDIKNGQSFYLVEQLTGKLGEKTALSDDGRFQIMEIVNAQNKAIDGTEISKEDILKRVYRLDETGQKIPVEINQLKPGLSVILKRRISLPVNQPSDGDEFEILTEASDR
ncbi:hypothetical protein A3J20_01715 [Candidatus Gottesmanbacteria bacterium RIFCSPLOWO2_02_FULL_42_29]|uniref:Uncharacterized protein n=2 Tax=Candidatus Gottesmaniibacteriota TaxID=1752720 RepID=A0A1F6BBP6_9BACT|nr:MAG: hypothetical protein UV09_C0022G0026 [Candidatus Gottesmanbacteria bacterium GW2011_GWA2_42_18]OGG10759.1 MAG: hypothetical protein A2781_03810 [Candidatus Gottesmanbacteria bacterium RIFCSPHIGHO2_01_FULL_42_27]OGG21922.1 MAG: hypothetical protein A3E72_01745 [Candidatus Gottesmanbacteria bacterium RIFCSPHIGHO2_12_FULL_43_26]OGG34182.1 MAG: hypothetical protein A2968_03340 [Candidatus Gottesmanbacteria bacterium RIFCSPLOWO2_01_FULL_42_22]OGG35936.1 MAG: hypothetical protein A3G68_07355 